MQAALSQSKRPCDALTTVLIQFSGLRVRPSATAPHARVDKPELVALSSHWRGRIPVGACTYRLTPNLP